MLFVMQGEYDDNVIDLLSGPDGFDIHAEQERLQKVLLIERPSQRLVDYGYDQYRWRQETYDTNEEYDDRELANRKMLKAHRLYHKQVEERYRNYGNELGMSLDVEADLSEFSYLRKDVFLTHLRVKCGFEDVEYETYIV